MTSRQHGLLGRGRRGSHSCFGDRRCLVYWSALFQDPPSRPRRLPTIKRWRPGSPGLQSSGCVASNHAVGHAVGSRHCGDDSRRLAAKPHLAMATVTATKSAIRDLSPKIEAQPGRLRHGVAQQPSDVRTARQGPPWLLQESVCASKVGCTRCWMLCQRSSGMGRSRIAKFLVPWCDTREHPEPERLESSKFSCKACASKLSPAEQLLGACRRMRPGPTFSIDGRVLPFECGRTGNTCGKVRSLVVDLAPLQPLE